MYQVSCFKNMQLSYQITSCSCVSQLLTRCIIRSIKAISVMGVRASVIYLKQTRRKMISTHYSNKRQSIGDQRWLLILPLRYQLQELILTLIFVKMLLLLELQI